MPTIRRRGDAWVLCWWQGGKEHRRSLGAIPKKEADTLCRLKRDELRRERHAGVVALPKAVGGMPTLEQFARDTYLPWHAAEFPASHERIESIFELHLMPEFGGLDLDRITKARTEHYKTQRRAKAETVAKELRALQAALNRAVFFEIIDRNPIKGVKPPRHMDSKPPRWYTAAELRAIYANAKALPGDEAAKGLPANGFADYAPVWRLMANTGLRRAEAQQLKWTDVGKAELRVLSSEGARTKSGKWRQVPLSDGAQDALKALRKMTGSTGYVLPRMQSRSLTRAFGKALDRAGLDGSLHCLRHTFCAHLVSQGVPLRTVQVLAGHANMTTTERYAHLAPGHLRDAVSGLSL